MARRFVLGAAMVAMAAGFLPGPASAAGTGGLNERLVTPDGRAVIFTSGEALVPEDTDVLDDVYVWREGELSLVSTGPFQDPTPSGFGMQAVYLSADGKRALFETFDQLTADDVDGSIDVYERYRGKTSLLTTGPTDPGRQLRWDEFGEQGIHYQGQAGDGRILFFDTFGAMVPEDTDTDRDVYRRENGVTTLVSTDRFGRNGPGRHDFRGASADGARVLTRTKEPLLPEDVDNGASDAYAYEAGRLELVTKGTLPGGNFDASVTRISPDARSVVFDTIDSLEPNDGDVFRDLYQRRGDTTRLVSVHEAGASPGCSSVVDSGHGAAACGSNAEVQTADGSHVIFSTNERMAVGDMNSNMDLYDRSGGRTTWLSVGAPSDDTGQTCCEVRASADASRVLFESGAALLPEDMYGPDVFERSGGRTRLITARPDGGSAGGGLAGASTDARRVLISTRYPFAPEDTDGWYDVYERTDAGTRLVTSGPSDPHARQSMLDYGQSDDALTFYFRSDTPMTPDDLDTSRDLYRWHDGTTELITKPAATGG